MDDSEILRWVKLGFCMATLKMQTHGKLLAWVVLVSLYDFVLRVMPWISRGSICYSALIA